MKKIFLPLCFIFLFFLLGHNEARSETPSMPAIPMDNVAAEPLNVQSNNQPVFVELFSSEACAFCPPADRLLADLTQTDSIIGIACHVDYFTVKNTSFGQKFCTERQNNYIRHLRSGPNYTPQLVINGRNDVIGYRLERVKDAIANGRKDAIATIAVEQQQEGVLTLSFPLLQETSLTPLTLIRLDFDKPHAQQKVTYVRVASALHNLGTWDGNSRIYALPAPENNNLEGSVIVAQHPQTGHILAAGQIIY